MRVKRAEENTFSHLLMKEDRHSRASMSVRTGATTDLDWEARTISAWIGAKTGIA